MRPLQQFLATETSGGVLLLAAAAIALLWANAPGSSYEDVWARHLDFESMDLELSLRHWVNDALMALFFLVVGLEIKRELTEGELASPQRAALPVAAALGGMALPAALYIAINWDGDGYRGWGIPMATDIAFAVGVMALLGSRVPASLKVFLLALAIVDDIGAIAVIAVFYTDDLAVGWLLIALGLLAGAFAVGRFGVRMLAVYALIGLAAWYATYQSGVHATIAGVALALVMPVARGPHLDATATTSTLDNLEHLLHPWTGFLIVPLFALANAGVELGGGAIGDAASSRVTLGVLVGLVLGKPLGIAAMSWLAVRGGVATLPHGVGWGQVVGAGAVAGIGFTVSLFITELAFADSALVAEAKIGILAASVVAGVFGVAVLATSGRERTDRAA